MIDPRTYTLDWIESVSKKFDNTDKILVEKTIRALSLQRFNKNTDIRDLLIENPLLNRLNKLKKSNKEAFVYWCLANDNLPASYKISSLIPGRIQSGKK